MADVVIASFNVENLFARPKIFNTEDWAGAEPVLDAYRDFNDLIAKPVYDDADKQRMRELLVVLGIYYVNSQGAYRLRSTPSPVWAWLRTNRGDFDSQPTDAAKSMEIVANGRDDWIGWIELATEATNEVGTRMTARVIDDVDADVIAIVEAEDRPSLLRFNEVLLGGRYQHVRLIDGNDERGIDVGIMTKDGFDIGAIRTNVDSADAAGLIFSRDCAQYEITTPTGAALTVLVNHFKSQSGGGGDKRRRQAEEVRRIVDGLVAEGRHVVVLGDLNEGQLDEHQPSVNLKALFETGGPLLSCYELPGFDVGARPGSFDSCGISNRLDYIFISRSLEDAFVGGQVFRKGLWGSRKTRPDAWETYPDMETSVHQASDHAAVMIRLDL